MSRAPTTSDLVQIALAALQPRAAPAGPRPGGGFSRCAVLQLGALACIAAALGCGLFALWISAAAMLGAAGALLVVSAVLCAIGFAAFLVLRRTGDPRASAPPQGSASDIGDDALLEGGLRLLQERPVVTLAAAFLAGVFLGWQN